MRDTDLLKDTGEMLRRVFFVLCVSVVFTLYLAPSSDKVFVANVILAVAFLAVVPLSDFMLRNFVRILRFLGPVIILLCYTLLFFGKSQTDGYFYSIYLLKGALVCSVFFFIFASDFVFSNRRLVIPLIFVIPGVVHILVLVVDVINVALDGRFTVWGDGYGYLEFFKRIPRVGSRYVSYAVVHMICGAVLLISYGSNKVQVRLGVSLSLLGMIVLALMDARAAFFSIFVGLFGLILVGRSLLNRVQAFFSRGRRRGFFAVFVVVVAVISINSGFSRWQRFDYSVSAAVHDVFYSDVDISKRPFVDKGYWDETPVMFDSEGNVIHNFRSDVDQSAYLRFAWLFSGLKLFLENPLGVGGGSYMSKAWGLDGADVNSTVDSFFTGILVSFGLIGLLVCVAAVCMMVREYRRKIDDGDYWVFLFLLISSAARSVFDPIDGGYGLYLFACFGIFWGLMGRARPR